MLGEREADHLVGVVLGGAYRLVGRIGGGGMGVVYEAHHLRLQKRVAVKLMNRDNSSHQEALTRFHREAMIASRLGHPHLVNVVDFGTSDDGQPYFVMEFLEGEDLDLRLRRAGSLPVQTAIQIARQTASAVAAVHAKGIVHRDLKPANIFLVQVPGEPDFVKVLDFGVSKIKAIRSKLTDASRVLGTPEYMSPEQVTGPSDDVDHRTDQWALACIVWEMLTGRPPFSADDSDVLFYQLRTLPPPSLAKYVPDLSPALESVLLRALSKRPEDRYPSIRKFAHALEAAVGSNWRENTPIQSDSVGIQAFPKSSRLREFLSSLATAVGFLAKSRPGSTTDGNWVWPRAPRNRAALSVVGVTVAVVVAGVLFASGRNRAPAASPTLPAASAVGSPVSPLPSAPAARIDSCQGAPTTSAEPPLTAHPSKETGASGAARQFAGPPTSSEPKRPRAHARRTARDRVGMRPSQRLTIDDF
jgi:eukaryotic-like serine/threonine-protein kinase